MALLARLVGAIEPLGAQQVAEKILASFGSLARLVAASPSALKQNIDNGILADVLPAAKSIFLAASREDIQRITFDLRDYRLIAYLTALLGHEPVEYFHAVFLDTRDRIIRDERIAAGTWNQVGVRLRELMYRALDCNAAKLVLVHNHPSGVADPSDDDVALTRQIEQAAKSLGLLVLDHLIVAGPKVFSMRKAGLL